MALAIPSNYELCVSKAEIEKGTARVAKQISDWYQSLPNDSKESFTAVCLLRGGIFFCSDLLRKLDFNLQIEFARISTYDFTTNKAKPDSDISEIDIDFDPKSKMILVVDDICESGRTLRLISEKFLAAGAKEVKSAVLIKRTGIDSEYVEDFAACEVDHQDYLVGMGLDDKKFSRHLPDIYKIKN